MFTERSVEAKIALENIVLEFRNLGLIFELTQLGEGTPYHSPTCILYNTDKEMLTYGFGKGIGLQADVSALAESFEHFVSEVQFISRFQDHKSKVKEFLVSELKSDAQLSKEKAIEILSKNTNKEAKTLCREYLSVTSTASLFVPFFLNTPDYIDFPLLQGDEIMYSTAMKYASNSGVALGSTIDEALLHALLETCERDAFSLFLLSLYFTNKPKVRIVERKSISKYLLEMIEAIEKNYTENIVVFDMTSDIGLPAFCASFTRQTHLVIAPHGCGCSCSKEHALERAVLECLQIWHVYTAKNWGVDVNIDLQRRLDNLAAFPKHKAVMQFDIGELTKRCEIEPVDFTEIANFDQFDLKQQLKLVSDSFLKVGLDSFYTLEYSSEKAVCVNVFVPGSERFYITKAGHPILPNKRGRVILNGK